MPKVALVLVALLGLLTPPALAHGVPLSHLDAAPEPATVSLPAPDGTLTAVQAAPPGIDPSGLLPDLPWETVNRVTSTSGTPWVPILVDGKRVDADDAPVRGTIEFWCPPSDGQTSIQDGTNTFTIRAGCPYRIIDDADLMGSPQLAVKQSDPDSMAFFSLHGAGTTQGPSPRSRDPSPDGPNTLTGYSHTTFTSPDMGRSWFDNPWGSDGFGEHASGVMDKDGNLYIGALWSKRLGNGEFDYIIKLYKEESGRFELGTYQPSKTYPNRAAGNHIEEANLVYIPAATLFATVNGTDNGTANGNATRPADEGDLGNYTQGDDAGLHNDPNDRVMVVWHERARDVANTTTGKSSWIDAAWTDTTSRDNWTRLATNQLIGPCMAASNPVQWNGKAYIACVADAGYDGRSRAHIGDIDVWSIDPMTGQTELAGISHLAGGAPRLVAREDGRMAMTTTRVLSEDEVSVQMEFGWYGSHWDAIREQGPALHYLASNTVVGNGVIPPDAPRPPPASNSVREARVTAMALTDLSDTLFLVYMERLNVGDVQDPNPNNPFVSPDSVIEYKKLVATYTPCTGPDNVFDLQVGVQRHPFAEAIIGNATGVFDDLQDGMQVWTDPIDGQQRVYFAYGDHGVIQYGALVANPNTNSLNLNCVSPPPAPLLPAAAIPSALSTTSPASMLVGATVGLTATAMVGYLLAVKRKSASALATKAKK